MKRRRFQKLKRLVKVVLRKDIMPPIQYKCHTQRFGSLFCGWRISPDNLYQNSTIYSFGVGQDVSFDTELIKHFGVTIHAFDPTPKSIEWIKKQPLPHQFIMHEYGICDVDGRIQFNPPLDPKNVSHTILKRPQTQDHAITVPVMRLSTIMEKLDHREIDLIKMDIEGAEYRVISDIAKTNVRPKQLLIEFHHRFPGVGITQTKKTLIKLYEMHYRLFSVSDSGEEYGFINIGNNDRSY